MSATTPLMRLHGARLLDAGFHIIPIAPGKKFPGQYTGGRWEAMSSWSRFSHHKPSSATVDMWANWPGAGIGIVTGGASGVIGVDLDILDEKLAADVKLVIFNHLGITPLIRVGRAPKMMLVYRVGAPMSKISMQPIEVLAGGQQFVAYGVHPDTGLDYKWPVESPDDTLVSSLPLVTEDQIKEAVNEAYALIPEELRPKRLSSEAKGPITISSENAPATIEAITEALEHIPNDDLPWEDWKKILMATFTASRGSDRAYFEFLNWSRKSPKNNDTWTRKEWNGCKASVPNRIGFGTLHHIAKENGWVPSEGLDFNEEKRDAKNVDVSCFDAWPIQPAKNHTAVKRVTAANPEQRPEIVLNVGLKPDEDLDPATGEIIETPEPQRYTFALTAQECSAQQSEVIVECRSPLLDTHEPTKLRLTASEIENGTLPRAFVDKFPQEWLFTSSLVGRIAHWVDSCCLYQHRLYALMVSFALFGSIVGRQYRLRSNLRPNLNVITIGKTASGKEASRSAIFKLMIAAGIENKRGPLGGFSSGTGVVNGLFAQPNMLLLIDEVGKKIAAYSGKGDQNQREMIAMFLEAIANDFLGGKGYANSAENETLNVRYPNLNVFGSSQMEEITGALSSAASADGFVQRFLFVPSFADYVLMRRDFAPPPVPEALVEEIKLLVEELQTLGGLMATNDDPTLEPFMRFVELTGEAQERWYQLDDRKLKFLKQDRTMWARSVTHTLKVAMLEAIAVNPKSPTINVEGLESARRLVDWFTEYAEEFVIPRIADNATDRNLKKIKNLIDTAGAEGISKHELRRKTQALNSHQFDDVIKSLADAGQIDEIKPKTGKAGAPKTVYRKVA